MSLRRSQHRRRLALAIRGTLLAHGGRGDRPASSISTPSGRTPLRNKFEVLLATRNAKLQSNFDRGPLFYEEPES